jgi:aminotransferase
VTPDVVRQAGIASLTRGETRYTSNSGTAELRQAIVAKWAQLYGVEYDPDAETLVTVGGSEALYLALMAILNPGDEVLIPEPCFVSYEAEVIFAGGTPIPSPRQVETTLPGDRRAAGGRRHPAHPRHPHQLPEQPDRRGAGHGAHAEIAAVAKKHDLIVISDEIYDRLVYAAAHVSSAACPACATARSSSAASPRTTP